MYAQPPVGAAQLQFVAEPLSGVLYNAPDMLAAFIRLLPKVPQRLPLSVVSINYARQGYAEYHY